jgi:acetyltransferase-like isoleucine patch superfamily enzyme
VTIADGCVVRSLGLACEDNGNVISIGRGTEVNGPSDLAAIEGTTLSIGDGCLLSGGVHIRTGDSHSVTDLKGNRINPSKDVRVGDHVWIGMRVVVLKGASIPDHSVVAACAVVTKPFTLPNCAIGGNPAQVIRRDIDWRVERSD